MGIRAATDVAARSSHKLQGPAFRADCHLLQALVKASNFTMHDHRFVYVLTPRPCARDCSASERSMAL
eukprot:11208165-Lingulodinium_polyedra.AAC.1